MTAGHPGDAYVVGAAVHCVQLAQPTLERELHLMWHTVESLGIRFFCNSPPPPEYPTFPVTQS
jgi:hypothetical protein